MRRVPSPSSSSFLIPIAPSSSSGAPARVRGPRVATAAAAWAVVAGALVMSSAQVASADECPPGSWFCGNVAIPGPAGGTSGATSEKKAADTSAETQKKAAESPDTSAPAGTKTDEPRKGFTETTITTIGDDGKPTTIVVKSGDKGTAASPPPEPPPAAPAPPPAPPPRARPLPKQRVYGYEPPPPVRRRFVPEWGINAHLQGAALGDDKHRAAENTKMGGMGFAIRTRPWGHFAFDFGVDFINGIDFQGNRRQEIPLSLNALWFINPRSKAQFYFLGGINWSNARVDLPAGNRAEYSYFGAQGGAGLEIRFSRRIAMNLDFLGFIRGRTDDGARYQPEFVDPTTGRATNTSGGGLFRLGLTAYWH